jgi:hypothetical protein
LEFKKLALSCDASVLQVFPAETVRIAKRLMKNWWTKHGLPHYMQKIEEENWVSSSVYYLHVNLCVSLSNYLFLTSPKVMKASEVISSTRAPRRAETARERRLLREGPLLLRWLVVISSQR